MATTGISLGGSCCASSSSSAMAQSLLGYGGFSRKTLLSDPCKLTSRLFFFLLPRRFLQAHRYRIKQTLFPLMCGHDELEIVSVKELADGFLHLSFGIPSDVSASSKVDGLSSSSGEYLAGSIATPPHRLPSKFSKKSPIPKAVHRRKRRADDPTKQGKVKASPLHGSIKEGGRLMSTRPKSCFVKRSPIPARKSVESQLSMTANVVGKVKEAQKVGSISNRPRPKFVRRSPVPFSVSRHDAKTILSSADEAFLSEKLHETPGMSSSTRPKSIFLRKSPIVGARKLRSDAVSVREAHALPPSKASDNGVTSAQGPHASELKELELDKCKLAELKSLAKSKGLKGYSKLKKGELLDLLKRT